MKPRVVVTRPEHQAGGLARAFEEAGFPVARLPLLEVTGPQDPAPLDHAVARLASFDLVAFTSANAVPPFVQRLGELPAGSLPEGLEIAVVGPATARAVRDAGLPVHLEAERAEAEGLVEELLKLLGGTGRRVLFPQAADARPTLERGLAEAGIEVTAVTAYDKRLPPGARTRALELFGDEPVDVPVDGGIHEEASEKRGESPPGGLGIVTFTSPRIVRHFVDLVDDLGGWEARRAELQAVSIGPVTTRELDRFGVTEILEAESPGDRQMVHAVERS